MQTWKVYINRRAYKQLKKLPQGIQDLADLAILDLEEYGFKPNGWDVKKTGIREYRLRLTYRYRMRYIITDKLELEIEIFYIGHRRDAYR